MTTAWLVWQGEWDCKRLFGAYSSEEVAKAWADYARKTADSPSDRHSVRVEALMLVDGLPPQTRDRWAAPVEERDRVSESRPVDGIVFALTGTLPKRSRDEVKELIEAAGGEVSFQVNGASYLVAGDKPGSKLDRAKQLGIPVISEVGLEMLLGLEEPKA